VQNLRLFNLRPHNPSTRIRICHICPRRGEIEGLASTRSRHPGSTCAAAVAAAVAAAALRLWHQLRDVAQRLDL
jgi:hypothetical protein